VNYFCPVIGGKAQPEAMRCMHLAPFNQSQVQSYLQEYMRITPESPWDEKRYLDEIKRMPHVKELIGTPLLLRIVTEVLPTITKHYGGREVEPTRFDLYDAFVDHWFQRGIDRMERLGQRGLIRGDPKEKCLDFCIDFAWEMYWCRVTEVSYTPGVVVPSALESPWKRFFDEKAPELQAIFSCCPIRREGNNYRFIHRSFFEFFLIKNKRRARFFLPVYSLLSRNESPSGTSL